MKVPERFILIPLHIMIIWPNFQTDYTASAWAVLSCFGSSETLLKDYNGHKVHWLENVMTMCIDAHRLFDRLEMWLQPTVRM